MKDILVPVAPGELVDKLTILRLKSERIEAPEKLANVQRELARLEKVATATLPRDARLEALWDDLYEVNVGLWDIEDDIRRCEARGDFGKAFIALARAVYVTNDRRARLKKQINLLLGSDIVEEKSYASPDSAKDHDQSGG